MSIPKEESETNLTTTENSNTDDMLQAERDFSLALIKAKRNGVDVSGQFLEVKEQAMLATVRMFGLSLGIVYVFMCPLLIPLFQIYCFQQHMPYALSEWYYYWPCAVGIVSILAFGYNLVDPHTLKKITNDKPPNFMSKFIEKREAKSSPTGILVKSEDYEGEI